MCKWPVGLRNQNFTYKMANAALTCISKSKDLDAIFIIVLKFPTYYFVAFSKAEKCWVLVRAIWNIKVNIFSFHCINFSLVPISNTLFSFNLCFYIISSRDINTIITCFVWNAFKIIAFLLDLQEGYTKYPYFLCFGNNRANSQDYEQKGWPQRTCSLPGNHNVKTVPLAAPTNSVAINLHQIRAY